MTNAELISMVRSIAKHGADWRINEVLNRAADALEAAEKRIAELEAQTQKRGECKKLLRNQWINYYECSICGNRFDDAVNYCPNCGCRMDGETK